MLASLRQLSQKLSQSSSQKIFKFVLTGGPCAGKTSAMNYLQERFQPQFKVVLVPELATMTMQGGIPLNMKMTKEEHTRFTVNFMTQQMHLEDYYIEQSKLINSDIIIIADRGMLDNTAYCSEDIENAVYQRTGWDRDCLMNQRYDQVLHMVTAANGAEEFYTLSNNVARSESPEQARELDLKTQRAWLGHHNHVVIGNELSFKEKIQKVYQKMCNLVKIPVDANYMYKWTLGSVDQIQWPADLKKVTNKEQIDFVLCDEGYIAWLKYRKGDKGGTTYTYNLRKVSETEHKRVELKRSIDREMYQSLLSTKKDFKKKTQMKEVTVFIWEGRTYLIDYYYDSRVCILRVSDELGDEANDRQKLPPFLDVKEEVTRNPDFMMYNMAHY